MSPEMTPGAEAQPAGMSQISRLAGVFFEPKKTFEDIAERPKWFAPLLIFCLAMLAYFAVYGTRIGWSAYIDQQMETNPAMQQRLEQMSPDQRASAIRLQERFVPIAFYGAAIVGLPVTLLLSSALMFGLASGVMSAGLRFKQVFAISCYSALPNVILRILAIVVMFLKNPGDFNVTNPVGFNPAAYMDPVSTSRFAYTALTGVDLFTMWALLLSAVGIKAAAGRRMSFGGALFVVVLPWAVLLLASAAASTIGS
jgi:hypothetical protein